MIRPGCPRSTRRTIAATRETTPATTHDQVSGAGLSDRSRRRTISGTPAGARGPVRWGAGTATPAGANLVTGPSQAAIVADGSVVLVGVPLGNPADASDRVRQTLADADVVAAEDTRRLARLARDLGIRLSGRLVSYFEGNEERRTASLIEAARSGARVALVSD